MAMGNYRVIALAAVTLVLAGVIGGAALFQWPSPTSRAAVSDEKTAQTISVSGEGTLFAEPDSATVQLGVQTTAPTAQEAQQRNAEQMSKVIDQIVALGIDRKDIKTSSISLSPTYDRQGGKSPAPTGYQANNQVNVIVRDLKKVVGVLDTSVAVGANTTAGVSFGIQDDSRLRQEVLAKSVENARQKAETIAKSLGVKITGVQSVAEDGVNVPRYDAVRTMAAPAADSTPVMPGQLSVVGHTRVIFTY